MAEYIEREALLKAMRGWPRTKQPVLIYTGVIVKGIMEAPAADVAPVVHGRWEVEIDFDEFWGDLEYYKCSVCGNRELRDAQTPYCPNCGAKMDGE